MQLSHFFTATKTCPSDHIWVMRGSGSEWEVIFSICKWPCKGLRS